jgi:DNA adenine methylase
MRVRIKVHSTRNAKGFCSLSVTISCKPKNLNDLPISSFSLDNENKLPKNLMKNNTEIIHNISPLRYPGGKTRACHILETFMLKHFDMTKFDTLLSPFFGGGSFEFYIQNNYNLFLCVNDKFTPLYNFWKQVQSNKHILCSELRKITSVSKTDFLLFREKINEGDLIQQALKYFIINRCSFSGATFSGGFSSEASTKRFTLNSIQKIEELNLNKVELYNDDFPEFLEKHTKDKTLLFLDPPYYLQKKSKLYGKNGDLHENFDHQKLYDLIITRKNWILTYNDCEFIRNLYKDFLIFEINWKYGMNKSKESCEIVIINS